MTELPPLPSNQKEFDQLAIAPAYYGGDRRWRAVASASLKFGNVMVPVWDLEPGDLLLFREAPVSTVPSSRTMIRLYQRALFPTVYARWHHVALYVGNGEVRDAVRNGGVRQQKIGDIIKNAYQSNERVLLRRMQPQPAAMLLHLSANSFIGSSYGGLGAIITKALARLHNAQLTIVSSIKGTSNMRQVFLDGVVCSEFAFHVLADAHQHQHFPFPPNGFPLPADFSASNHFSDLRLAWHRL